MNGNDERGIIAQADLPAVKEKAAGHQNDNVENIGNEGGCRVELPHGAVSVGPCGNELLVANIKLFLFLFGIVERFGHTNARNTALHSGIDLGNRFAAALERRTHFAAKRQRDR